MDKTYIEQIEKVLDERVRPELSLHGGNIQISEFKDKVLKVRFTGQCSGCPSSQFTMENLVETELKSHFPDIEQVVSISGVSDALINEAKNILKSRKL